MGVRDGNIIATIIATHMPMNDAAALGHVCPHIRIHAIDIVHPPGIGISPIADMDAHQAIVTAALAAKSNAEMQKKARRGTRSDTILCSIYRPRLREPYGRPRRPRRHQPHQRPDSARAVLVVTLPPDTCLVAPL